MFLLLLVPVGVVVVMLAIVGFAGIGPLTEARRADRVGMIGGVGPAVALLLGILLLVGSVVASAGLVGIGGHRDDGGSDDGRESRTGPPTTARRAEPPAPAPADTTTLSTRPAAGDTRRVVGLGPVVAIEADGGEAFPVSYDVADGLGPSTVLQVRATGFEPFARGAAQQCVQASPPRCGNRVPVQFGAEGTANFQYLVTNNFRAARGASRQCGANAAPCSVVVRASVGGRRGEIQTVFGGRVPPAGRIRVTPARGLALEGETVTVEVDDFPPGSQLTAMLCAAPDATGARCGAPGPTAPLRVRRDGTGRTQLALEPGRVGTERAPCFRGDDCGVSVVSKTVFARAPVAPIWFAAPPGASYDTNRLAIGLGIALLLAAVAAALLRRTDWSPIGEAAAPEIDDAQYADLDAIIAALPPIEDEPAPAH